MTGYSVFTAWLLLLLTLALALFVQLYHASASGSLMGDNPAAWFLVGVVWGWSLARVRRRQLERHDRPPPPASFRRGW